MSATRELLRQLKTSLARVRPEAPKVATEVTVSPPSFGFAHLVPTPRKVTPMVVCGSLPQIPGNSIRFPTPAAAMMGPPPGYSTPVPSPAKGVAAAMTGYSTPSATVTSDTKPWEWSKMMEEDKALSDDDVVCLDSPPKGKPPGANHPAPKPRRKFRESRGPDWVGMNDDFDEELRESQPMKPFSLFPPRTYPTQSSKSDTSSESALSSRSENILKTEETPMDVEDSVENVLGLIRGTLGKDREREVDVSNRLPPQVQSQSESPVSERAPRHRYRPNRPRGSKGKNRWKFPPRGSQKSLPRQEPAAQAGRSKPGAAIPAEMGLDHAAAAQDRAEGYTLVTYDRRRGRSQGANTSGFQNKRERSKTPGPTSHKKHSPSEKYIPPHKVGQLRYNSATVTSHPESANVPAHTLHAGNSGQPRKAAVTSHPGPANVPARTSVSGNGGQPRKAAVTSPPQPANVPVRPYCGTCPFESCVSGGVKLTEEHAFLVHNVPLIFHPALQGSSLTGRRAAALILAGRWRFGTECLKRFLLKLETVGEFFPLQGEVDSLSLRSMKEFAEFVEPRSADACSGRIAASANSVGVLVHWRVVLRLMLCMIPDQARNFRDCHQLTPEENQLLETLVRPVYPHGVDGHFHLDRTMGKLFGSNPPPKNPLVAMCEASPPAKEKMVILDGGVANFCDPPTYPSPDALVTLRRLGLWVTVGLHPKNATHLTPHIFGRVKRLVSDPNVSGLGEIGLDFTAPADTLASQFALLGEVLPLLGDNDKVLVLHCRGNATTMPDDAAVECLLLALSGQVRREQRIHFHCYTGGLEQARKWLSHFPRTMFGFTNCAAARTQNAFRGLETKYLILETDSPYFSFGSYPGKLRPETTPSHIGMVAACLALDRSMEWGDLLRIASGNVARLYNNLPDSQE